MLHLVDDTNTRPTHQLPLYSVLERQINGAGRQVDRVLYTGTESEMYDVLGSSKHLLQHTPGDGRTYLVLYHSGEGTYQIDAWWDATVTSYEDADLVEDDPWGWLTPADWAAEAERRRTREEMYAPFAPPSWDNRHSLNVPAAAVVVNEGGVFYHTVHTDCGQRFYRHCLELAKADVPSTCGNHTTRRWQSVEQLVTDIDASCQKYHQTVLQVLEEMFDIPF